MEKMNDLKDLLKHEIQDLYSAEEQIIKAMPAMIGKAKNPELKKALEQHLKVTEVQRGRLEQVQQFFNEGNENQETEKKSGLLSRLFKRNQVCKGMQGIIQEGEKVMSEDMSPEVLDAAIVACAQKIEHYEICGYGTARAYARELNMGQVAELLEETLDEEYEADDRLTDLAVGRLNEKAERGTSRRGAAGRGSATRQPARSNAMEVEMVSGSNNREGDNEKESATGRGGSAKGSTRGEGTGRTSAAAKRTAANGKATKSAGKTAGRSSGGRNSGEGSGGGRGR